MTSPNPQAPGKAMWLGEYVVLGDAPAIVAAVNRHARCSLSTSNVVEDHHRTMITTSLSDEQWLVDLKEPNTWHAPPETFALLHHVLKTLRDHKIPLKKDLDRVHFSTENMSLHSKLGIGSSAAVAATAMVAFADATVTRSWNQDDVYTLTHQAHQQSQGGIGSGSDIAAACYGGILQIQKGQPPKRLQTTIADPLVIYTGNSAHTATFVQRLQQQKEQDNVHAILQHMSQWAQTGADALTHHHTHRFMTAVRHFHQCEQELSRITNIPIVTPAIEQIVSIIHAFDGAGKASGAGGGDIVIGFFDNESHRNKAAHTLTRAGYAIIPLAVERTAVLESIRGT